MIDIPVIATIVIIGIIAITLQIKEKISYITTMIIIISTYLLVLLYLFTK